ncbi:MAG: FAD-binding protein [Myxococcota bacterium]
MDLAGTIQNLLGVAASDAMPDTLAYARDLWPRHHIGVRAGHVAPHRPAAVAWPESTEQAAAVVHFCGQEGIPIVPFGAGSGVCGGIAPDAQTLVLDLKRMRRWRKFAPEEGILDVEAGALGIRLEEDLQAEGYTVGHFPSSILCSTVGGWVAARGAGQCSGLYGKIEDMVVGLEVIDGRGEVGALRRRRTGPDLTPLMIGSEGTFGVLTSVRLRLHRKPERRHFAALGFPTMEAGYEAIRLIYQGGLRPAVCRLYDPFDAAFAKRKKAKGSGPPRKVTGIPGGAVGARLLRFPSLLNQAIEEAGAKVLGGALLILVFEGVASAVAEDARALASLSLDGATDLGPDLARNWMDRRYAVSYRQSPVFRQGAFVDTMEVAATWKQLPQLYDDVRRALGEHVLVMAHMSHAYPDGCSIYFTFAGERASDEEASRVYDHAWRDALHAAVEAGGTIAHHHGVGRSKAPVLGRELGVGIDVIRRLKGSLDPHQILNPGNLIPAETESEPAAPPVPSSRLDATSMLINVEGEERLADVEAELNRQQYTLGLDDRVAPRQATVAAWLAAGAVGARDPLLDPVDQLMAGFSAGLPDGNTLVIRPSPRTATGPDLRCLFVGMEERVGPIERGHLRFHHPDHSPRPLATNVVREPPLSTVEERWVERFARAARGTQ